ncbi:MAG: hypothetical protein NT007_16905 [Candidatus Kapabacteria bacterium]|nr:hypothetical protein [Candidatus Kapabacteria bacterium]
MSKLENSEENRTIVIKTGNVSKVVDNFRTALLALLPIFDNAGISWGDEDQFEDFEAIAENLYRWMVNYKLENFVNDNFDFMPTSANYGFYYKDYTKYSFVEINTDSDYHYPVVQLKSKDSAFDTILCNEIDANGQIVNEGVEFTWDEVQFRFLLKKADNTAVAFV